MISRAERSCPASGSRVTARSIKENEVGKVLIVWT